jgi:hypothetical protein
MPTAKRVTLTKAQLATPQGVELVRLLSEISEDGVITYEELKRLTDWLNANSEIDIPAVRFLFEHMMAICRRGTITNDGLFDMQLAIERVLPKESRQTAAKARLSAYHAQPASERQLEVLQQMTGQMHHGLNRDQASELITAVNQRPSNRQLMFLRFWGRMDIAALSRHEISEWMDAFITADQSRMELWNEYKQVIHDDGSQRDPSCVPIGAHANFSKRSRRYDIQGTGSGCLTILVIAAILVGLAARLLRHA